MWSAGCDPCLQLHEVLDLQRGCTDAGALRDRRWTMARRLENADEHREGDTHGDAPAAVLVVDSLCHIHTPFFPFDRNLVPSHYFVDVHQKHEDPLVFDAMARGDTKHDRPCLE